MRLTINDFLKRMTIEALTLDLLRIGVPILLMMGLAEQALAQDARPELAFISDTQAPMWLENIFLKANQNEKATALIFDEILKQKPKALFLLGDVVSLGYKEKKWKVMDQYLEMFKNAGIGVAALLGNHDVMVRPKKGGQNFQKRFTQHVRTGYVQVIDSIGVILLNSNFRKMTSSEIDQQQKWLIATLTNLDKDPEIMAVIVTCHHPPFTHSKIVGPSILVQQNFVPPFIQSRKSRLFVTGHSHAFEHFRKEGKDFLIIGGGGGLHQPLSSSTDALRDISGDYKPMFHYLRIQRTKTELVMTSYFLKKDFDGFEKGNSFNVPLEQPISQP